MGRGLVAAVQASSDCILNYQRLIGKERMAAVSVGEVESLALVNLFNIAVDLRE